MMMLGNVISMVLNAGTPVNIELVLCGTILYPAVLHVHVFGQGGFGMFVCKTEYSFVTGFNQSGILWMPYL